MPLVMPRALCFILWSKADFNLLKKLMASVQACPSRETIPLHKRLSFGLNEHRAAYSYRRQGNPCVCSRLEHRRRFTPTFFYLAAAHVRARFFCLLDIMAII
jgi:hypothetical protein